MQMRSLRGKNLIAGGYDPIAGVLAVRFANSGEYQYTGVPENIWVSLQKVPYPDKYFTQVVKGKFPVSKPTPPNYTDREDYYTTANRELNQEMAARIAADNRTDKREERKQVERSRVMEVYFPQDGMEFVGTENGKECHYYRLKGERIQFSLTQVLELSGLARQPQSAQEAEQWAAKAKLGTKVHEYTLWLDWGEIELDDLKAYPDYYNRVLGWKQFREDFKFMPDLTMCEVPIAVRVNGMLYAMKLDAYGAIGDENALAMAVVEKKCSVNIEPHYALQTAGQALAFKAHAESLQFPLKRFVVQLLDKPNGSGKCYKCVEHTDRNDEKVFVGAGLMNVYTRLNYGTLKGI